MRAAPGRISAPFFPAGAEWVDVATLRLDQQPAAWSGAYEAGAVWAVLELGDGVTCHAVQFTRGVL